VKIQIATLSRGKDADIRLLFGFDPHAPKRKGVGNGRDDQIPAVLETYESPIE
jgi:hypothetical protein